MKNLNIIFLIVISLSVTLGLRFCAFYNENENGQNNLVSKCVLPNGELNNITKYNTNGRGDGKGLIGNDRVVVAGNCLYASNDFDQTLSHFIFDNDCEPVPRRVGETLIQELNQKCNKQNIDDMSLAVSNDNNCIFVGMGDILEPNNLYSFQVNPTNCSLTRSDKLTSPNWLNFLPYRINGLSVSQDNTLVGVAFTSGFGAQAYVQYNSSTCKFTSGFTTVRDSTQPGLSTRTTFSNNVNGENILISTVADNGLNKGTIDVRPISNFLQATGNPTVLSSLQDAVTESVVFTTQSSQRIMYVAGPQGDVSVLTVGADGIPISGSDRKVATTAARITGLQVSKSEELVVSQSSGFSIFKIDSSNGNLTYLGNYQSGKVTYGNSAVFQLPRCCWDGNDAVTFDGPSLLEIDCAEDEVTFPPVNITSPFCQPNLTTTNTTTPSCGILPNVVFNFTANTCCNRYSKSFSQTLQRVDSTPPSLIVVNSNFGNYGEKQESTPILPYSSSKRALGHPSQKKGDYGEDDGDNDEDDQSHNHHHNHYNPYGEHHHHNHYDYDGENDDENDQGDNDDDQGNGGYGGNGNGNGNGGNGNGNGGNGYGNGNGNGNGGNGNGNGYGNGGTQPPIIICKNLTECQFLEEGLSFVETSDDCSNSPNLTHQFNVTKNAVCDPQTKIYAQGEIVFTSTDSCGNSRNASSSFSLRDVTPPVIEKYKEEIILSICEDIQNIDVGQNNLCNLNITDSCTNVTCRIVNPSNDTNVCKPLVRTYELTDECGNSRNVTRVFKRKETMNHYARKLPIHHVEETDVCMKDSYNITYGFFESHTPCVNPQIITLPPVTVSNGTCFSLQIHCKTLKTDCIELCSCIPVRINSLPIKLHTNQLLNVHQQDLNVTHSYDLSGEEESYAFNVTDWEVPTVKTPCGETFDPNDFIAKGGNITVVYFVVGNIQKIEESISIYNYKRELRIVYLFDNGCDYDMIPTAESYFVVQGTYKFLENLYVPTFDEFQAYLYESLNITTPSLKSQSKKRSQSHLFKVSTGRFSHW
eukprot:TRINITY_DN88_c0_g1_i2.p1 TRINITY_DN88_c0_g1~~TRINITY_DN88_c0_g1_i2.p1  ORF type:complete len:1035 (-),score=289.36 TRINITY_DN88_c0_g1_i2:48-3152(-)